MHVILGKFPRSLTAIGKLREIGMSHLQLDWENDVSCIYNQNGICLGIIHKHVMWRIGIYYVHYVDYSVDIIVERKEINGRSFTIHRKQC